MNIAEMHVNFRQYAQQMGMQNVRAIRPEQIDIAINQSIMDEVNQLIHENVNITNDKGGTNSSNLGQINALRTLYAIKELNIIFSSQAVTGFFYNPSDDKMEGHIKYLYSANNFQESVFGNIMYINGMDIKYSCKRNTVDMPNTKWYPVRIVESTKLADTMSDEYLKNTFKSPISSVYINKQGTEYQLDLYIQRFDDISTSTNIKFTIGKFPKNLTLSPYKLRVEFIKYPDVVKYDSAGNSVNCNLPAYLHGDIVKHAVDLYRASVYGPINNNQQNQVQPS